MKEDIEQYMSELGQKLEVRDFIPRSYEALENFPITNSQCLYIINYKTRSITFQKRVEDFLGYSADEFTFDLAIDNFHPDDRELVVRLIKGTLIYASENDITGDVSFFVSFRIKLKDGTYKKVLRQSTVFEYDNTGKIISNISLVTDIGYLTTNNKVEWRFDVQGLDQKKFGEYIKRSYRNFFSNRELEILELLKQGHTSEQIAGKLFISKHTVDTHRRNMLQKTNTTNSVELLNFYTRHVE